MACYQALSTDQKEISRTGHQGYYARDESNQGSLQQQLPKAANARAPLANDSQRPRYRVGVVHDQQTLRGERFAYNNTPWWTRYSRCLGSYVDSSFLTSKLSKQVSCEFPCFSGNPYLVLVRLISNVTTGGWCSAQSYTCNDSYLHGCILFPRH
jgi:hypothetical protein